MSLQVRYYAIHWGKTTYKRNEIFALMGIEFEESERIRQKGYTAHTIAHGSSAYKG